MEPLRKDVARNREQILIVARELLADGELPGMNAIAHAAGLGVGTVYRHFATITELEEALVWKEFDALAALMADARADQLDEVLTALFGLLVEDAVFERVTSRSESSSAHTAELRGALIRQLDALIASARDRGALRVGVTATEALLLLCGIAHSLRGAGMAARSAGAQALLGVVLDGMRSRGLSMR